MTDVYRKETVMAQKGSKRNLGAAEFGARLVEVMRERSMGDSDLARALSTADDVVDRRKVYNWKIGRNFPKSIVHRVNLPVVLGVSRDWLYQGIGPKTQTSPDDLFGEVDVPLIDDVETMPLARAIVKAKDEGKVFATRSLYTTNAFAVIVKDWANAPELCPRGHPRGYHIAVVNPDRKPKEQEFVYVEIREGRRFVRTFRVFYSQGSGVARLVPLDNNFPTYSVSETNQSQISIIGTVVDERRIK